MAVMKEWDTVKLYGKELNRWTHIEQRLWKGEVRDVKVTVQVELAYREYDWQGNLIATGSEDFSKERFNNLGDYRVFGWDGKRYNKGGYRWHDELGYVVFDKKNRKFVEELMAKWNPNYVSFSFR